MLKLLVKPDSESDTIQWKVTLPPDYDSYSVESLHGYLFNQVFVHKSDKLTIETDMKTKIQIVERDEDDVDYNYPFVGFYDEDDYPETAATDEDGEVCFVGIDDDANIQFYVYIFADGVWQNSGEIASYCGIGESPVFPPQEWSYYYNTVTEHFYIYRAGEWRQITINKKDLVLKPIVRYYKSVYKKKSEVDEEKRVDYETDYFDLVEFINDGVISINLTDSIENEYVDIDSDKQIGELRYEPLWYTRNSIDNHENNRKHYKVRTNEDTFYSFNTMINTRARKKSESRGYLHGLSDLKGSSIYDQFIQHINLLIYAQMFDTWILSKYIYYRSMGTIKFYSAESSHLYDYTNTVFKSAGLPQFISHTGKSTSEYFKVPPLYITSNLKLGSGDMRVLYPVGVITSPILTLEQLERWKELDAEETDEEEDDFGIFSRHYAIGVTKITATPNLNYQLFGTSKVPDMIDKKFNNMEVLYNNKCYDGAADTVGFFRLWSGELYIAVDSDAGISVNTNISSNISSDKVTAQTVINNVVFMFNQTSPSFNWMTNALPYSKIEISSNRTLTFTLYDFCGRRIPTKDNVTELVQDLMLELTLTKELQKSAE